MVFAAFIASALVWVPQAGLMYLPTLCVRALLAPVTPDALCLVRRVSASVMFLAWWVAYLFLAVRALKLLREDSQSRRARRTRRSMLLALSNDGPSTPPSVDEPPCAPYNACPPAHTPKARPHQTVRAPAYSA